MLTVLDQGAAEIAGYYSVDLLPPAVPPLVAACQDDRAEAAASGDHETLARRRRQQVRCVWNESAIFERCVTDIYLHI